MSRRVTGTIFCLLAVFLFILPDILAVILASGTGRFENYQFIRGNNIIHRFNALTVISLITGIFYLIWAEIDEYKKKK